MPSLSILGQVGDGRGGRGDTRASGTHRQDGNRSGDVKGVLSIKEGTGAIIERFGPVG